MVVRVRWWLVAVPHHSVGRWVGGLVGVVVDLDGIFHHDVGPFHAVNRQRCRQLLTCPPLFHARLRDVNTERVLAQRGPAIDLEGFHEDIVVATWWQKQKNTMTKRAETTPTTAP